MMEGCPRDDEIRNANNYVQDVFEVEIRLDSGSVGSNGWPSVYEVGGRAESIARNREIPKIDLHLFEDDSFCVGLKYTRPRRFSLRGFILELVVPFLYRLAYVDRFGLKAAQRDLWKEYSHGPAGHDEYQNELATYAQRATGRNEPCPCGSGKKAKKCCLDEIQEWRRRTAVGEPVLSSN